MSSNVSVTGNIVSVPFLGSPCSYSGWDIGIMSSTGRTYMVWHTEVIVDCCCELDGVIRTGLWDPGES